MRVLISAFIAVGLTAGIGCGGGGGHAGNPASGSLAKIESSIRDGCKTHVVQEPFPDDPAHARLRSLAESSALLRCVGKPKTWAYKNLSAYARFATHEQLTRALSSIKLPPARYEELCVTDREAFTTEFTGSYPICRRVGGERRRLREPPIPNSITRRTYLPASGIATNLVYGPRSWSNGGMAGSDNVNDVRWRSWTRDFAVGAGTSGLRGPCAIGVGPLPRSKCRGQNAYYQAPARVLLDKPRSCNDQGSILRFFSRARSQVYMRPGNPFNEPVGWTENAYRVKAYKGKCFYFPAGPLSG
jgi:hypothetical protein